MKKIAIAAVTLILAVIVFILVLTNSNSYQTEGTIEVSKIDKNIKIIRDKNGMAYIYADNIKDALFAQGFVTAQERLFQMGLMRRLAKGKISELAGEKALQLDIQSRTIGFYRNAQKHSLILNNETKEYLQSYVNGINAFITRNENMHLEFTMSGLTPESWTIEDCMSLFYYMGWNSAANVKAEIVAQMLIEKLGPQKAGEVYPLASRINSGSSRIAFHSNTITSGNLLEFFSKDKLIRQLLNDEKSNLEAGSNNWVISPQKSASGKAIVVNDPHLKTEMIPGPWFPTGLITPEIRAIGATVPGIPGMIVGRTNFVALGATNSYHDVQDLYIETIDPNDSSRYKEGTSSIPFTVIKEKILVKDKEQDSGMREVECIIKLTKRGPVISNAIASLKTDKVISMRWSPFESMDSEIGLFDIIKARDIYELREGLSKITNIMLNFVFADTKGNTGWFTTGKVPIRSQRTSSEPFTVKNGNDNWTGWIPKNRMPQTINPAEGWIATCNHRTMPDSYQYYLSSYFAPDYRYRRIKELLTTGKAKTTTEDHWNHMRDCKNLMAVSIAPIMAKSLTSFKDTTNMGKILSDWNHFDNKEKAAPLIFHAVYRRFAYHTFKDELGEELVQSTLNLWYLWQEKLEKMILNGSSPWFDNISSDKKESMKDIFHLAAQDVYKEYSSKLGEDPGNWKWGDLHKITFVSPIMRKGFLKGIFGGGTHPMSGSGETLYRAIYKYKNPFSVTKTASLRMVADLGDDEKIAAILTGGTGGRVFNSNTTNQVESFINGEMGYWWFSDKAIRENSESELLLLKK